MLGTTFGRTNAATFEDSHNYRFAIGTARFDSAFADRFVHVPRFAADEGFVYLDFAAKLPSVRLILHRKANPVKHEPSGLLGDFDAR